MDLRQALVGVSGQFRGLDTRDPSSWPTLPRYALLVHDAPFNAESVVRPAYAFNFHPLENTATTSVTPAGLLAFLTATGHSPLIVDLPIVAADATGATL